MKSLVILLIILSTSQLNAQTYEFPFGIYCFEGDECITVIKDSDLEGETHGNIFISRNEVARKFIFDPKKKIYVHTENGDQLFTVAFKKNEESYVLILKDIERAADFNYEYVGTEESQEETGSGIYGDAEGGYEYGIDEEPMMGYYDDEDQTLVGNPHHLSNEEYFNPKKNEKLPLELLAYDFTNKRRVYDIFELGDPIPEDVVDKIVAILEFTSFQYTVVTCYAVYNEADQTHDCYTDKNKLYAKIRFTPDFHYVTFLDLKTKQEIGTMNLITGDSEEFTPPNYLLQGSYTLLDGTNAQLVLDTGSEESEDMSLEFPSSPYGSKYILKRKMESSECECFLTTDLKTALYTFNCDREKSGVINLKDLKTGKIVSAKYNFDGQ